MQACKTKGEWQGFDVALSHWAWRETLEGFLVAAHDWFNIKQAKTALSLIRHGGIELAAPCVLLDIIEVREGASEARAVLRVLLGEYEQKS